MNVRIPRAAAVSLAVALACGRHGDAPAAQGSGTPAGGGSPGGGPTVSGPSGCGDTWHGIFQIGPASASGIAVDGCNVALVGGTGENAQLGARSFARRDPFLARLDASGTPDQIVQFGTSSDEEADSVAIDGAGNRWVAWSVAGRFEAGNTSRLSRFAPDGTETLEYSVPFAASSPRVVVDAAGDAYLAATRAVKAGAPSDVFAYTHDVFVVKVDGTTGAEVWSIELGTPAQDGASGVALDASGSLLVAGRTWGDLGGNRNAGDSDGFVARIGPDGKVAQVLQLGGPGTDSADGVAVDGAGNVYVVGGGAFDASAAPGGWFVAKLDRSLAPVWHRQVAWGQARAIAVGPGGDAWVAGSVSGAAPGQTSSGGADAFVARFDSGGTMAWVRQFGSAQDDFGVAIAVDGTGNSFAAGQTMGTLGAPSAGTPAAFVAKIDGNGNLR